MNNLVNHMIDIQFHGRTSISDLLKITLPSGTWVQLLKLHITSPTWCETCNGLLLCVLESYFLCTHRTLNDCRI